MVMILKYILKPVEEGTKLTYMRIMKCPGEFLGRQSSNDLKSILEKQILTGMEPMGRG